MLQAGESEGLMAELANILQEEAHEPSMDCSLTKSCSQCLDFVLAALKNTPVSADTVQDVFEPTQGMSEHTQGSEVLLDKLSSRVEELQDKISNKLQQYVDTKFQALQIKVNEVQTDQKDAVVVKLERKLDAKIAEIKAEIFTQLQDCNTNQIAGVQDGFSKCRADFKDAVVQLEKELDTTIVEITKKLQNNEKQNDSSVTHFSGKNTENVEEFISYWEMHLKSTGCAPNSWVIKIGEHLGDLAAAWFTSVGADSYDWSAFRSEFTQLFAKPSNARSELLSYAHGYKEAVYINDIMRVLFLLCSLYDRQTVVKKCNEYYYDYYGVERNYFNIDDLAYQWVKLLNGKLSFVHVLLSRKSSEL
jgi:hypothetical protein